MGKFTILLIAISTTVLVIAYSKGLSTLRAGDTSAHLFWDMAAFFTVLAVNFVAAIHALQSDRLIRNLREECARLAGESAGTTRA